MIRQRRIIELILICILIMSFSACRQRTTLSSPPPVESPSVSPQGQEKKDDTSDLNSQSEEAETDEPKETPSATPARMDAQNDSQAPDVVEVPSDDSTQSNTENDPNSNGNANTGVTNDTGNTVTVVEPSESGQTTLDNNEGSTVQTIVDKYTQLLEQGVGTLYPCQVNNVYFETVTDYLTVNKRSSENQLIEDSGGLNAADMLGANALNVNDDWVIGKNPDAIVKCVGADVLGSAIHDTASAQKICTDLCARPNWGTLNAVTYKHVILLSEELFKTEEGRLAAKLYIASAMYPTLFSNVDLSEYCRLIFGENCGIYAYSA